MEPADPSEKLGYWREHIRRAALFDGTQGKYAEQNGISASKLSYYKGILNPKPTFAKVLPETRIQAPTPPKEPAKSTSQPKGPDAIWLATFLKELFK